MTKSTSHDPNVTRRRFVATSAALAAAPLANAAPLLDRLSRPVRRNAIRVGVIGCGGRGTGAAVDALTASEHVSITALGDVFEDRVTSCRERLASRGERATVPATKCFSGFDAYRHVVAEELDMVILATPPGFRPAHFEAAVDAGKHIFVEKPVAVDGPGARRMLAAGVKADEKGLCVVAGTQRRHERCYLEGVQRIHDGAIGRVIAARCYWNMGSLWMHQPRDSWTDMEWHLRNWLYFTWLSGDHIVEQHVHNLDVVNWVKGAHPVRAMGMGGRQVRTDPNYGHIFDHFAIEYEYPDGMHLTSMCRQTDGCYNRVAESFDGVDGRCETRPGYAVIRGENEWRFRGENGNPYVHEHVHLTEAILGERERINETRNVTESTLTAIMGRMSAYTGREVTWEQALNSQEDLTPEKFEFGPLPMPPVAMPGRTPLI